ncbi:MAG: response regulator [Deltaproteobacteria bacterium]|nr:response regulator [Deltaproteobacteria bacterium]
MAALNRAKILCVDDEVRVVEGLQLTLGRRFDVRTATSGAEGLELLRREPDVVVIISDMRMPQMDGTSFLAKAKELVPDATRMLLTGQADLDSAIAVVNRGHIFRFLTKPASPSTLTEAVEASIEQHRLVTAERVLLSETLHGSIRLLTEVLGLANPVAFGRGNRLKRLVAALIDRLGAEARWEIEVAAMLVPVQTLALTPEIVAKIGAGQPLSEAEQAAVDRGPALLSELLVSIPRMEVVREVLIAARRPLRAPSPTDDAFKRRVEHGAQILRVATDFDALESGGESAAMAVDTMRGRAGRYEPAVLDALAAMHGRASGREVREVAVSGLKVGMVFAEDVRLASGMLLIARGHEVTPSLMARLENYPPRTVREPLRVII